MAATRKTSESSPRKRQPPAKTPDEWEKRLVGKAFELAEQQIEDGSVSAQVLTHYLKLGTRREKLERERLERENELLRSKIESLNNQVQTKEIYEQALKAMRQYSGQATEEEYE